MSTIGGMPSSCELLPARAGMNYALCKPFEVPPIGAVLQSWRHVFWRLTTKTRLHEMGAQHESCSGSLNLEESHNSPENTDQIGLNSPFRAVSRAYG